MLRKLGELVEKHKSILLYMSFGLLTTIVNYLVYFPLLYIVGFTAVLSNTIAWFFAVAFSFVTNKPFVFDSHDWSLVTVLHELVGFFGCRFLTGAFETAVLFVLVDVMDMNGFTWKLLVSVVVIIFNYLSSKRIVFRKK